MFVSDCLDINSEGHLTIGGADTTALAEKYGTPLYVMDEQQIRKNCRAFAESMKEYYGGNGLVLYASKAMCCKELCRICNQEGLGLDVVSGGELYTALAAGFPAQRIYFHGNNKTRAELEMALDSNIGRIIVDNYEELETLNDAAVKRGKKANILLRIKPGVEAHTHEFIKTGQIDSKFGFALETGEAMNAVKEALSCEGLYLAGLDCHIGSQIFEITPFKLAAEIMLGFIAEIKSVTGFQPMELDLGGGFGIKYMKYNMPPNFSEYMSEVSKDIKKTAQQLGLEMPFILIEPGRSIVGETGLTLYTVGSVKEIPGIRTYVAVDGGMFDNPRYILYQAQYEAVCANRAKEKRDAVVTLAGKCCESGDLIGEGMKLQNVVTGDIIAVLSTGAYNYSMSSNYNRNCRPPVVMVKDGEARVVVRGESYEDVAAYDV